MKAQLVLDFTELMGADERPLKAQSMKVGATASQSDIQEADLLGALKALAPASGTFIAGEQAHHFQITEDGIFKLEPKECYLSLGWPEEIKGEVILHLLSLQSTGIIIHSTAPTSRDKAKRGRFNAFHGFVAKGVITDSGTRCICILWKSVSPIDLLQLYAKGKGLHSYAVKALNRSEPAVRLQALV